MTDFVSQNITNTTGLDQSNYPLDQPFGSEFYLTTLAYVQVKLVCEGKFQMGHLNSSDMTIDCYFFKLENSRKGIY